MNITPYNINLIQQYLKANPSITTLSDLVTVLNTQNITNPNPQTNVPAPFDFITLKSLLSASSLSNLAVYVYLGRIIDDIRNRDRVAVQLWAAILATASIITSAEATAITAAITTTIPDPTWTAQISWAQLNFGNAISVWDIQQCNTGLV